MKSVKKGPKYSKLKLSSLKGCRHNFDTVMLQRCRRQEQNSEFIFLCIVLVHCPQMQNYLRVLFRFSSNLCQEMQNFIAKMSVHKEKTLNRKIHFTQVLTHTTLCHFIFPFMAFYCPVPWTKGWVQWPIFHAVPLYEQSCSHWLRKLWLINKKKSAAFSNSNSSFSGPRK